MNNRYPYPQDARNIPGIPAGFPFGPRSELTSYSMAPSAPLSYAQNFNPASGQYSQMPYPSVPVSCPVLSPYPSAISPSTMPYPSTSVPYPSASVHYPGFQGTSANVSSNIAYTNFSNQIPQYPSVMPPSQAGITNMHARHYHSSTSQSSGYNDNHLRHSQGHQFHNMAYYQVSQGTVKPFPGFDPQQDAQALRKAMKGLGTDEKAIIDVLAKRSNEQRVYIAIAFKQLFGKDLIEDLKSELRGNFEDVVIALMTPSNDYLASEVHKAMSGIGTDEDVLIEVLCSRTNHEIWGINDAYRRLYGKSLEDDIKEDTSGHFQRLLVSTCTGARSEAPPDDTRAKQKAHELYTAGVGQWGTDESMFNAILVAESFQQLAHTFYEYQKLAGHSVYEAIEKEMSGDLKKGMLAIARCVENKPLYFAEKLYKAMKGLGTDDRTLIRVIVSRCEIDMVQIKAEYERNFEKPLAEAVKDDTSGDYRRVLIALVDGF